MTESFNAGLRMKVDATVIAAPEECPWVAANDADIMLVRPTSAWTDNRDLARPAAWPGRLKWVYSGTTGIDFYPRWLLDAPVVTCGRGIASDQIADYVMAAIYLQAKDLEAVRVHAPSQWKTRPLGRMAGSTVGLLGFGAIGTAVARRALAAGVRVTAVRRRKLPSPVDGVELLDQLEDVVASADHLVLALPATDSTRLVIDAAMLGYARPGAHLINVGRGAVLDHEALIDALDAGRLGFATLDVTEPEPLPEGHRLWTHDRVRLTPHVSANHTDVHAVLLERVAANIDRFVRGEALVDIVDKIAGY
ncbi:dehydrogenase [Sphingobium fluviale]|uniref:Dehydrogenase n=2 Tax=Sphingobium fluviale TaxID=2506423 RepID=A0A4Q1KH87_9SPHN|nr:dehydrogenase [Sphingobium fluviale]